MIRKFFDRMMSWVGRMKGGSWKLGFLLFMLVFLMPSDVYAARLVKEDPGEPFVQNLSKTFTYLNHSATPTVSLTTGWTKRRGATAPAFVVGGHDYGEGTFLRYESMGVNSLGTSTPGPSVPGSPSVTWKHVAKIKDQWVNVKVTFSDMIAIHYTGGEGIPEPNILLFDDFWQGFWALHIYDFRVTYAFTYDSGSAVNMTNSFITLQSLNEHSTDGSSVHIAEGFYVMNGSSAANIDYYVSTDTLVQYNGGWVEGTSNSFADYAGSPTIYKASATGKVPSRNPKLRIKGNAWAWYCPLFTGLYPTIPELEKDVDKDEANEGDIVTYTLEQYTAPTSAEKFDTMWIVDSLDEGLDYVSCDVYTGTDLSVSAAPSSYYTVQQVDRDVVVTMSDSYINSIGYGTRSSRVKIVLKCKINATGKANGRVTNDAQTYVNIQQTPGKPNIPKRIPKRPNTSTTVTTDVVSPGYSITTSKDGEGTISASESEIPEGENRTVTYSPASGWYLESVTVDGSAVNVSSYDSSYTFSNISSDHTVHVVFKPCYKITTSAVNGTITSTIDGIKSGESKTITYSPNEDCYLESITVDGSAVNIGSYPSAYTFSNVTANHSIAVVYRPYCHMRTYVRWRNADGTWSSYTLASQASKKLGDSYSYTWVRNVLKTEPENVYYDGNPKTVGVTSVTESKDYYIDVERKKYTYTFEANPPAGYAVIGISNLQPNLENRWAETISGNVTSPSLTGYTFVGWNTRSDGSGSWYASESMLSNKTFYAIWRKNKYQVHYDPNSGSNPNHLEGEAVQNLVTGVMPNSEYEYDTKGALRPNAFIRNGYEFIGWNTRPDGSGTAYGSSPYDKDGQYYSDGYPNVYNMTTSDGAVLNLYAQWRKKLGSEVLTIVSEETGNPVANVKVKLYKKVNGSYVEVPGIGELTTNGNGQVSVSNLHWFDYEWRCTSVPKGYETLGSIDFAVRWDHLDWSHRAVLYLKRVNLILHARVSDIIAGERAPSFLYQVSGTDAAGVHHEYVMEVAVDGSTRLGDSKAQGMYAGTYSVMQMPVSRYVPQPAENVLHSTVSGINGTADLLNYDRAEIRFPYVINQYEGFGSMNHVDNLFKTNVVEIRSARSFVTSLISKIEGIPNKTSK